MNTVRGMESFPEPRDEDDPDYRTSVQLHTFNQFMPWELRQDGTTEETLNHVGRHELGGSYTEGSFSADRALSYLMPGRVSHNRFFIRGDGGLFQMREDAHAPGTYYVTYAREFGTASAGALLRLNGAPGTNPEDMVLTAVTHPDSYQQPETPSGAPNSTGHYRNPLPMSDGTLIASHTTEVVASRNAGSRMNPRWNYAFRLKVLRAEGMYQRAGQPLTAGIRATLSWWDPDQLVTFEGELWELDAVEVRARPRPAAPAYEVPAPERAVMAAEGVELSALQGWLRERELALIVSRDVTVRDRADVQQPYNLRVPGGASTTGAGASGAMYDVPFMQLFQADALRGYGGVTEPRAGRRLLARPMHGAALRPTAAGTPAGSVRIARDGSMAAFVPARRALTWQLTDATGAGVVRERNWVSFAPGEVRVCASCHGVNTETQSGGHEPVNQPEALRELLRYWRTVAR